jgi:ribulose-5-phosphate 4-epimerase/fuculose-1-phosphate aldolase
VSTAPLPPLQVTNETQLASLCDILRAKGVTEFTVGNVSVKLGSMPDNTPGIAETDMRCNCGHEDYQHGPQGECLIGCPIEKCAPEAHQ